MEPQNAEAQPVGEPKSVELVPEFVSTKKIRNIEKVQQKVLQDHIEPMLNEAFQVLRLKLRAGDKEALRLSMEIGKLIGGKASAVTVNTNVQQNNANEAKAIALSSKGFDDLVRRLDNREYQVSTDADFIDASV